MNMVPTSTGFTYSHETVAPGHDLFVEATKGWDVHHGRWFGECQCQRHNGPDSYVFYANSIVSLVDQWEDHLLAMGFDL